MKSRVKVPRNNRIIHFEIGMIAALLIVFSAFEYKSYQHDVLNQTYKVVDDTPVDYIMPTTHKEKKKLPPKPNISISVVEEPVDPDLFPDIDASAGEDSPIPDWEPEMKKEESIEEVEPIVLIPSVMPEFPGGVNAMMMFIANNIEYPKLAREANISGTVFIGFVVEKDGAISNIELVRSIGGGCDEEALRIVQIMPRWNPGKQRGVPVRVRLTLPVKFTLR